MYTDLRGFIAEVDKLGALRRVVGADPDVEIGGITEVAAGLPECPALLFERIKGCRPACAYSPMPPPIRSAPR